jgi:tRNA modification GTPase
MPGGGDGGDVPRPLVARLTPPGPGGISVILLAGPGSLEILSRLFVSPRGIVPGSALPGRLLYGRLIEAGEPLDEAVVCRLDQAMGLSPAFEINCHGGATPCRRVLRALVEAGALEATWPQVIEAGRQAGALDAIQAEAEVALPDALNLPAARMLLAQRGGALSRLARQAMEVLGTDPIAALGLIEPCLTAARYGRRLVAPARVGVAGRPNVGKSSIMNALLRHERVLVHPLPGTTRDVIEETCDVAGVPVRLADMAGVRDAADPVEAEGVRRAREAIRSVDLVVLALDGSEPLTDTDMDLLAATAAGERIVVANKSDLPRLADLDAARRQVGRVIEVSAKTGAGLRELEEAIAAAVAGPAPDLDGPVSFTERQARLLQTAGEALGRRPPDKAAAGSALRLLLTGEPAGPRASA